MREAKAEPQGRSPMSNTTIIIIVIVLIIVLGGGYFGFR